uniref:NADH-ubiquinone oxidoreductase chain 5 n=1 Tax=Cucujus mniszechi TaxID=433034 RepID=A0A7G7MUF5_9CUCU|nr:NADH dehydrogenase subunit 5 [Cucujus mniszechi]QNG56464.1 NADH dehydrogenase subunit 5 [Cucujus mniszechi]
MSMICVIYFLILLMFSIVNFMLSIYFMVLNYTMILEYHLISLNSSSILMTILLDWMSLLFMSFVMFISSMVIFYSSDYMHGDKNIKRFILLVVLFVLSMMFLIISPNLISLLLGWDGLGLVSYCLVIYYQNIKSFNAGMLTALTNRVGDVALLMSIAWIFNYGSWNYLMYVDMLKVDYEMGIVGILVILAALTKSAQIPFSSWLPAAMAAPTPVSSLVHSSTLVTAGVYLLIRFNFCFNEKMKMGLLIIASLTMFMSGLGASFEYDLKKIIALSTLSQLGLMLSILALGEYVLAFYHLLTHALFKALLFMCAGNIIHNLGGCQDIRFMGGLVSFMPLTCAFLNVSNFSLCGIPFMSGFYSKDLIVEIMSMQYLNVFIYMIFYLSIGLTVCYSVRLSYYLLIGNYNSLSNGCISDSSKIMLNGMSGLIFFVIFSGSMLSWLIFPSPYFICLMFELKIMTLLMVVMGAWLGYEFSKFNLDYKLKSLYWYKSSMFFSSMWNMPIISTLGVNFYPIYLGGKYKMFDQGWIELYGSKALVINLVNYSSLLQFILKNHLKIYFMLMMIWLMFMFIF